MCHNVFVCLGFWAKIKVGIWHLDLKTLGVKLKTLGVFTSDYYESLGCRAYNKIVYTCICNVCVEVLI